MPIVSPTLLPTRCAKSQDEIWTGMIGWRRPRPTSPSRFPIGTYTEPKPGPIRRQNIGTRRRIELLLEVTTIVFVVVQWHARRDGPVPTPRHGPRSAASSAFQEPVCGIYFRLVPSISRICVTSCVARCMSVVGCMFACCCRCSLCERQQSVLDSHSKHFRCARFVRRATWHAAYNATAPRKRGMQHTTFDATHGFRQVPRYKRHIPHARNNMPRLRQVPRDHGITSASGRGRFRRPL
jgi:hypothetical protein